MLLDVSIVELYLCSIEIPDSVKFVNNSKFIFNSPNSFNIPNRIEFISKYAFLIQIYWKFQSLKVLKKLENMLFQDVHHLQKFQSLKVLKKLEMVLLWIVFHCQRVFQSQFQSKKLAAIFFQSKIHHFIDFYWKKKNKNLQLIF